MSADPWRAAIDDALIVNHLSPTKDHEAPREALHRLLAWEAQVALDPLVSADAAALVERGRRAGWVEGMQTAASVRPHMPRGSQARRSGLLAQDEMGAAILALVEEGAP